MLDGFDGWRFVAMHIWQGVDARQGLLMKSVKNLPMIKSLEEVASGVTRFEEIMKAYKDAGGVPPPPFVSIPRLDQRRAETRRSGARSGRRDAHSAGPFGCR
jgi:hypothetical protein